MTQVPRGGRLGPWGQEVAVTMDTGTHRSYESLAHAAERTGMSIKTLRRRIAGGELAAYRSGRLIRVEPVDVDRLMVPIPTMRRQ